MECIELKELPVHDTLWSITTGADGRIYLGVCGECTGGLSVFLVSYEPESKEVDYLVEVGPYIGEPPDNGRATHSKIHYCLIPASDGLLYCATHCTGAPVNHPIWRPWNTWDDRQRMFSGFHIFTYDPVRSELEDLGAPAPNEGSRIMALAERHGLLYGITYPRNHFYSFDYTTKSYHDLGRIGEINPQTMWLDKEENAYTVDEHGFLVRYLVAENRLENLSLRIPIHDDQPYFSIYDSVPAPDGQSVYGVSWNCDALVFNPHLFRHDLRDGRLEDLGPAYGPEKVTECVHVGGMVFGEDGYLYFAVKVVWKEPRGMLLVRMDPDTLDREEIGMFDNGKYTADYIAKATIDFAGNLYFCECANRPCRVFIHRPERAGRSFRKRWPIVRPWG